MAVDLGSAFGKIGIDLTPLRQAATGVRESFGQMEQAADAVRVTITRTQQQTAQAIDRLKGTINLQQRQYHLLTREVEAASKAYGDNSVQAERKRLALDKLSQAIANNNTRLATLKSELQQTGKELNAAGSGAGSLVNRFEAVRGGAVSLAGALGLGIGGIAALGAAIKGTVSAAASFEAAMARVGAISGATGEDMSALTETARTLGATTVFSASEAAEGMQFLAMAGFDTNEIIAAMPGLLDAAAAAQMDLGRAADIVSNVMTGFGLAANEAGRAADVLVKASVSANTTVEQLGSAMKMVAPVAASLGISLEDATAAVSKMSDAGIQGEMAGTALRGAMIRLSAPTKEAASLMASLGINAFDAQGNMKALPDVIAEFTRATGDMTAEQRANVLQTVVGTEAMAGFLALMSAGPESLRAFGDELRDSAGTASEIAAQQMDTLQGSVKAFWSAVEGLQIALGTLLLPVLRAMVDGLTAAARATQGAIEWTLQHADAIRDVLQPVLAGVAGALTAYAVTQIPALIAATAAAIPVVLAKAAAMGALAVATLAAAAPFIALAAAIGGAVLVYQKWNSISEDAVAMWERQREEMVDSADSLNRYAGASRTAQGVLKSQADRLRDLRDAQREEMLARADAARQGDKDAAWWEESNRRSNERLALIGELSEQLDGYIDLSATGTEAELRAAIAADQHAAALRRLRDEGGLTEAAVGDIAARMAALSEGSTRGASDVATLARLYGEGRISAEQLALSLGALEQSQAYQAEAAARAAEGAELEAQAARETARAQAERAAAVALAAGDIDGALSLLRGSANVTEEAFEALSEALQKAADEGAASFGKAVANEVGFQSERETSFAAHTEKMAELAEELAKATTDKERESIQEKIKVAEAGYAEQERKAAEAYARQQAAQLAHLGQMLIDYAAAQGEMAGLSAAQIGEMTRRLADEYGVQESLTGRSFGEMTRSIDAWVAGGGQATDQYISDLGRIRSETVTLQQEVDRNISAMTDQARADFAAGKIDIDQYAERLRLIPKEARIAAEALLGIPKRIESEVRITTIRTERTEGAGTGGSGNRTTTGAGLSGTRAAGGPVAPGAAYLVGEEGPEIVVPRGAGTVLPAGLSAALRGAASGGGALPGAAAGGGAMSITVAPVFHGLTVDSAERLEAMKQAIVEAARQAGAQAFSQSVDQLILSGGSV